MVHLVRVLKGRLACAEKMPVNFSLDLPGSVVIQSIFRLLYMKFNELQLVLGLSQALTVNTLAID